MDRKRQKKTGAEAGQDSEAAVEAYTSAFSLKSDPQGSYTGRPKERGEKPEQDADDL